MRSKGRVQRIMLITALTVAPIAFAVGDGDAGGETPWPTHEWRRGTPASVGLDETVLATLDSDLASGKYGLVDSFQVFRCGTEVYNRRYSHDYAKLYWK